MAARVVDSLQPASGLRWLDVGCGTGALSEAVVTQAEPLSLLGVDPSDAYVSAATARVDDPRATFVVGDATTLPVPDASIDEVASGLVLNFVPETGKALSEMRRVLVPGGRATAYVWDYADRMEMLRIFWDAAIAEDSSAGSLDEGARFPLCREGELSICLSDAGMSSIKAGHIDIDTTFRSFDDYWQPYLGGQGPSPSYLTSLTHDARERLRDRLRFALPHAADGSIRLVARAWVCQGYLP